MVYYYATRNDQLDNFRKDWKNFYKLMQNEVSRTRITYMMAKIM